MRADHASAKEISRENSIDAGRLIMPIMLEPATEMTWRSCTAARLARQHQSPLSDDRPRSSLQGVFRSNETRIADRRKGLVGKPQIGIEVAASNGHSWLATNAAKK